MPTPHNNILTEEKTPMKKTHGKVSSTQDTALSNRLLSETDPFHIYLKHIELYATNSSLSDLLYACNALIFSACSGYEGTTFALQSKPKNLLLCNLPSLVADEFHARLKKISSQSPYYAQARFLLFGNYYLRRDEKTYATYQERFEDIYLGIQSFNSRKNPEEIAFSPQVERFFQNMIIGYPKKTDEENLIASTWRILALELAGENPLSAVFSAKHSNNKNTTNNHYPFRLGPMNVVRGIFAKILSNNQAKVDIFLQKYQQFINNNIEIKPCSAEDNQSYVLNISAEYLQNPKKPTLIYLDKKTNIEIARFEFSQGRMVFKAYGNPIHLRISGQLATPISIFENPGSTLELTTDFKTEQPLFIAGKMDEFILRGVIHSSDKITLESSGKIEIPTESVIINDNNHIIIKAQSLQIQGKIFNNNHIELLTQEYITTSSQSLIYGGNSIKVTAGSLKEIDGRMMSDEFIVINISDKIDLRNSADICAKSIYIKAEGIIATGKAKVEALETIYVEKLETLLIDKESVWTAPNIRLEAKKFENYSPHLSADQAHIHCEDEFIQYTSGKIKTIGKLILTGGSVWNTGEIDFGKNILFKLNKYCVLGLTNLSSISSIRETFSTAKLKGDHVSVIAGVFFNFASGIEVRSLSISSILLINLSFQRLNTTQQSCLFELDGGITIPNIQAYRDDIKSFFHYINIKEYGKAYKMCITGKNFTSAISGIRSACRTLIPAFGQIFDLIFTSGMALYSSEKLIDKVLVLNQTAKKRPLERSDIIQVIASASNVASQLAMVESQAMTVWNNPHPENPGLPGYKIPSFIISCFSAFAPSHLHDSLLGFNVGNIEIGGNIIQRSLFYHSDYSAQLGFNVNNIFYSGTQNHVLTVANAASNIGTHFKQSGSTIALSIYNNAQEQKIDSTLVGLDVAVRGEHIELAGSNTAISFQAIATDEMKDASHTVAKDATIFGKNRIDHTVKAVTEAEHINIASEHQTTLAGKVNCTAPTDSIYPTKELPASVSTPVVDTADDAKETPPPAETKPLPPNIIISGDNVDLLKSSNINASDQTVAVISNTTTDNTTCNVATYIDQAKSHLNVGKDAHHNVTKVVVYAGKEASLQGDMKTEQLFLDIDHLSNQQIDALLTQSGEYKGLNPTSLLSIKTLSDIILTHNYELPLSVEINGRSIEIYGEMHSKDNLIFTATVSDISNYNKNISADHNLIFNAINGAFKNFYGDLSAKIFYVHTRDNITNIAGTLQAETQLRLISDAGGLVNQGGLRDQVYTGARLIGGNGNGYNNVGLAIKTLGILHNEGSSISSQSNMALNVGKVDNIAADYTTLETKTVTDPVPLSDLQKLALFSTDLSPTITLATKGGNANISTVNHPDPNSRASLVIDSAHGNASVAVTPPLPETISVNHTVASHIAAKDTLSAEVKQGDWNNLHSTVTAGTILTDISHGNFNNTASLVQGVTFVGIHANDINNTALAHEVVDALGGKDQVYETSAIVSGNGQGHDGIAMVLQADGWVHFAGSVLDSAGDNVVISKLGIDIHALHNTYISYHRVTSNWLGRDTETTEYSERIQPSIIFSANGSNYMMSSEGDIRSVSTEFLAARDNVFIGKHNIDLLGLVATTLCEKDVSTLCGINDCKTTQADESAIPTIVMNPNNAIFLAEGDVRILNAAVIGQDKVAIKSGGDTIISAPSLNHSITTESRGISIDSPALSNGTNAIPLLKDGHDLLRSRNAMEAAANIWNSGIDTMNAVSNMMAGAKNNSPTQSLFSASYLSGINLSYTYSKSTQTFQTVATNVGINCGTLVIEAGNKIVFSNGVTISVLHFADLTAKEFWQLGAKLENSFENNSVSGSVGISLDGNLNFGAGVSHYDAHGTTYVNQTFTAGDGITIHVQSWSMQNANTITNNLKTVTDSLSMVSDTDKSVSQSFSGQINTNGDVSAQGGSGRSNIINNPTGINAGHIDAETKNLTLKGSQIIAASGTLKADHVKSESVDQFSRSDSIGLSTNISSDQAPSSGAFEKPITTTNVSLANKDYAATQNSTIFIPQGPGLEAKSVDGPLNTANASGLEIDKDEQYAFTLEVPDSEKSWEQVGDNLASVSKQTDSGNHVGAGVPAYIRLSDKPVHDDSNYYDEGEEKQNLSSSGQDTIEQFTQQKSAILAVDDEAKHSPPAYLHKLPAQKQDDIIHPNDSGIDKNHTKNAPNQVEEEEEASDNNTQVASSDAVNKEGRSYLNTPENVQRFSSMLDGATQSVPTPSSTTVLLNRLKGASQAVFGVAEVTGGFVGGVISAETGVGPVLGGVIIARGLDNISAGVRTAASGQEQKTQFNSIARNVGLSESATENLETALDIGVGSGASTVGLARHGLYKAESLLNPVSQSTTLETKIELLNPFELQVTHEKTLSNSELKDLIADIKENGFIEPIEYVEHEGKKYVVDGNHRLFAARKLDIKEIPGIRVELPHRGYQSTQDLYYFGQRF